MNEKQSELTSVLLDGELPPEAERKLIKAITGPEREELDRFGRYCLMGDVIRGESSVLAVSVAAKVHESLLDEPVVLAPQRKRPSRWFRPVAGIAVAASVAVVAILVAPQLMTQTQDAAAPLPLVTNTGKTTATPVLVAAGAANPQPSRGRIPVAGHWQGLTPDLEARLNRLVIEHHEFGGRTGINGPVPHIGLVSYGAR